MAARQARHWYDLSQLAQHRLGQEACLQIGLLGQVVADKMSLFPSAAARYDLCLSGGLRLTPNPAQVEALTGDYLQMAQMFYEAPPTFAEILAVLSRLEAKINELGLGKRTPKE